MKDSEFTRLLTRATKAASKHADLVREVTEECIRRYGVDSHCVDADAIIDMLDTEGGHSFTATQFDEIMKECM